VVHALEWHGMKAKDIAPGTAAWARLDTSEHIQRRSQEVMGSYTVKSPAEAYDQWQTLSLLQIGHLSYGRHHYFATCDLVTFLSERTPDAFDLVHTWATDIASLKPLCVLYIPHLANDILVDRLVNHAEREGLTDFPSGSVLPVNPARGRSLWPSKQLGPSVLAALDAADRTRAIVILDDALVTGDSLRQLRGSLRQLGFRNVYSFVVLDRRHHAVELQTQAEEEVRTHRAWWMLSIPHCGTKDACTFCRGVDAIRSVASASPSVVIREHLREWAQSWAAAPAGHTSPTLAGRALQPATKRLRSPTPNVVLRTTTALATWAFDMIDSIDYCAYALNPLKWNGTLEPCRTEVAAGLVFLFWDRISDKQRQDTLEKLADRVWTEARAEARALVAVAAAALPPSMQERLVEVLEQRIQREGLPHVDAAFLYYQTIRLGTVDEREAVRRTETLAEELSGFDHTSDLWSKTYHLLRAMSGARRPVFVQAIRNLERRGDHPGVDVDIWDFKVATDARRRRHALRSLSEHLDPIRELVVRINRFKGVRDTLLQSIDEVEALLRPPEPSVLWAGRVLARLQRQLMLEIMVDGQRFPSVQALLYSEYLHYLPASVEEAIEALKDRDLEIDDRVLRARRGDFLVEYGTWPTRLPPGGPLREADMVLARRSSLQDLLRDLLSDVKHPMRNGATIADAPPCFMRIVLDPVERTSGVVKLHLENVVPAAAPGASADEALLSARSWAIARLLLEEMGGEGRAELVDDRDGRRILRRTLTLPALAGAPAQP
jgi:hypothetical protein